MIFSEPPTAITETLSQATDSITRLANNLAWSWAAPSAMRLFEELAPDLWRSSQNPVAVLHSLSTDAIEAHAGAIRAADRELTAYLESSSSNTSFACPRVAYFSAEFGVARCLPLYAGGLGVLAGDYLKAASDLGLRVIGIGLLYRYGYFKQGLDDSGYQTERFDGIDPCELPLRPVVVSNSVQLRVSVPLGAGNVLARVWRADVGRLPLYLMDTNLDENTEVDRWITGHLYGGDVDTRIRQEVVLGVGGARLLRALQHLGLEAAPEVHHLNEGHSAFLVLELMREALHNGSAASVEQALADVAERVVFTTHTPVSAGHDAFPSDLVETYLCRLRAELGLSLNDLMDLGRLHVGNNDPQLFSMTALALRGASRRNAVSQLQQHVSSRMWGPPMIGITNGVHSPTWVGEAMGELFDDYLGRNWRKAARDPMSWSGIARVPARALWSARRAQRGLLLERVRLELGRRGLAPGALPDDSLIIGFARRFTTYKRPGLLLEDAGRLERLVSNPQRPVLFVFAGKAHPSDDPSKMLVQRIVQASLDPRLAGHLVFIEDYDIEIAQLMVQGCDVWLNTPRRPFEASGTSGMKATLNGAVHVSELDGWWHEAYRPDLGWALGDGVLEDLSDQAWDAAEARQLMDVLEWQVTPMFFARDGDGVPEEWLAMVKRCIMTLAPMYSADRMVTEYVRRMYMAAEPG